MYIYISARQDLSAAIWQMIPAACGCCVLDLCAGLGELLCVVIVLWIVV